MGPSLGITCGPIGMESSPIFDGPRKKTNAGYGDCPFYSNCGIKLPIQGWEYIYIINEDI